jgi:hypothetical protein
VERPFICAVCARSGYLVTDPVCLTDVLCLLQGSNEKKKVCLRGDIGGEGYFRAGDTTKLEIPRDWRGALDQTAAYDSVSSW